MRFDKRDWQKYLFYFFLVCLVVSSIVCVGVVSKRSDENARNIATIDMDAGVTDAYGNTDAGTP